MYPHSIFQTQPLARALVALISLKPVFLAALSIDPTYHGVFELIEDKINSPAIDGQHIVFGDNFRACANLALQSACTDDEREVICLAIFNYTLTMVETSDVTARAIARMTCVAELSRITTKTEMQLAS